jgi:hypothetical protein
MKNYKEIIDKLFNIWFHGKHKLIEFEEIFPDNKYLEDLREEMLPDFFDNLNEFYWEYFFLTIAKLLDSHKQGQNINLTLFTLSEILKTNEKNEWERIFERTNELKTKYRDIIKYRRKSLAHFDFDYSIGKKEFGTSTKIEEITYFFDEMLELINETYKLMELQDRNPVIIKRGDYKGGKEMNRILEDCKKYYTQQLI